MFADEVLVLRVEMLWIL